MMTGLSIINILISLVYQFLVAKQFGTSGAMDAYIAAMAIPAWISAVFATSLNFAFIPIFVAALKTDNVEDAWKIANTILKIILVVLSILCTLGILCAAPLIHVLAPGLKGEVTLQAAALLKILLPGIIFTALFHLLSGIHYSLRSFRLPSLAPILYVLVNIVILLAFRSTIGINSVAIGTTIGQAAQVVLLLPILFSRQNSNWLAYFSPRHPGVVSLIRLMSPLLLAGFIYRSGDVIERYFASSLPEGSISTLNYAMRILQIISSILISGIITAIFPLMAEQAAEQFPGSGSKLSKTMIQGMNIVSLLVFPITGWLIVLRVPFITFFLERGAFHREATLATANVLLFYLGFFVLSSLSNVLTRTFYVLKDTRTPAVIGILGEVAYVLIAAYLVTRYASAGLALALSLQFALCFILQLILVSRKLNIFDWPQVIRAQLKLIAAALCLIFITRLVWVSLEAANSSLFLQLLIPSMIGFASYILLVWFLRIEELQSMKKYILNRITKSSFQA